MDLTIRPPTAPLPPDLLAELRAMLGDRLSLSEAVRAQHGASETHFASVAPDAVAFAHSTDEVVRIVRHCAAHRVPITPFGAGTSLEGNALPIRGGLCLSLGQMTEILQVNREDMDCTVQAGVRREQLNAHLRDYGLFFPIDPGADATLGGMASTRASGTNAVRYGTMRDAVLSLRAVTAEGREIRTSRRARKSAAGYDLTRLLTGSEGTLAVITEVTVRLHAIPETICAAVCSFQSLEGAVRSVMETIHCGVPIARIELLDDAQMRAVARWSGLGYPELTTLFFEFHGGRAAVDEQVALVREIAAANGGGEFQWAERPEDRSRLWKARHQAYYAALAMRPGSVGWTTDVCVPISRLAECIVLTKADLDRSPVPATILGHVGEGNFHVVFALDPAAPDERRIVENLNARLVSRAIAMDGTCTGEHGIGLGKQAALIEELGDAVELMRLIKRAMDPQNLLNPGKIFDLGPATPEAA